ncbi:hypothetical protein KQI65_12985 [bacterium]|nr:hypothetical protein [bacterium]
MTTLSVLRQRGPARLEYPALLELPEGPLRLHRFLGKGKSGYSFHAVHERKEVVFKCMHDETCDFYRFDDAKTALEERDYHRLKEIGLPVPDLLNTDHRHGYLIKEFIPGMTAAEMVAEALPSTDILRQLFEFSALCRQERLNIDYFPTNFVIRSGRLYYIDYELNPYQPAWSLERWGLYYWANTAGMHEFLYHGSTRLLDEPEQAGSPLRAPFEAIVQSWIEEFGDGLME